MTDLIAYLLFAAGALSMLIAIFNSSNVFKHWLLKCMTTLLYVGIVLNIFLGILLFFPGSAFKVHYSKLQLNKTPVFFLAGSITASWLVSWLGNVKWKSFVISAFDQKYFLTIVYLARLIMSSYFAITSIGKYLSFDRNLVFFAYCGYSRSFLIFIMFAEGAGALLLLFRRTVIPGAAVLLAVMIGATITHYRNYFNIHAPDPFSNSLDSLKMDPFLLLILFATWKQMRVTKQTFRQQEITVAN